MQVMPVGSNPYPELARVLDAQATRRGPAADVGEAPAADVVGGSSIDLATATSAVAQALTILDQQLAAVLSTNIVPNFPGSAPMVNALAQMQQVAREWTAIKAALVGAAQATADAGPAASSLGTANAQDAAALAADVSGFVTATLRPLQMRYQQAKSGFDAFASALANADSAAANANAGAAQALDAAQLAIQTQINEIHREIEHLNSAGSIIIGILSGGITVAEEVHKLRDQIAALQGNERTYAMQKQAYSMAYSQFTNACSAESIAVTAIATVNTSLEQAVNSLNDINTSSSSNLVVMQAYISSFRQEFAGAVTAASSMLS